MRLWRDFKRLVRQSQLVYRAWLLQRSKPLKSMELDELVPISRDLLPPILDDICLPPHLTTVSDHDDLSPVLNLAHARQPQIVVELGTAYGNLVANICRQSTEAVVYTVNALPEVQTGEVITFALDRDSIGRVYRQYGYSGRVTQIYQNTLDLDLADYIPPASVDLAIVDACHDTAYVLNDFMKVAPFVRPQGLVLLHDTDPHLLTHFRQEYNQLTGSYLACLMLAQKGYDIHHLAGTWWAVWSPAFDSGAAQHEVDTKSTTDSG